MIFIYYYVFCQLGVSTLIEMVTIIFCYGGRMTVCGFSGQVVEYDLFWKLGNNLLTITRFKKIRISKIKIIPNCTQFDN